MCGTYLPSSHKHLLTHSPAPSQERRWRQSAPRRSTARWSCTETDKYVKRWNYMYSYMTVFLFYFKLTAGWCLCLCGNSYFSSLLRRFPQILKLQPEYGFAKSICINTWWSNNSLLSYFHFQQNRVHPSAVHILIHVLYMYDLQQTSKCKIKWRRRHAPRKYWRTSTSIHFLVQQAPHMPRMPVMKMKMPKTMRMAAMFFRILPRSSVPLSSSFSATVRPAPLQPDQTYIMYMYVHLHVDVDVHVHTCMYMYMFMYMYMCTLTIIVCSMWIIMEHGS